MRYKLVSTISVLVGGLLFLGAGCSRVADEVAEQAIQPIAVPIQAFKQAELVTGEVNARAYEESEKLSNDVQVPLILNPGSPGFDETEGQIVGCGDKLVFKKLHRIAATEQTMSDVLNTLLSQKESNVSGLYNALWQSSIELEKLQSRDGLTTEVWLKGKVLSGGVCDNERIKAQVEQLVVRFRPKYKVLLNGSDKDWRCMFDQTGECK